MLQWDNFFNFVRFQRLRCQIVRLELAIKSVNGDPVVRPLPWGQRSKEMSNFQLCPISTVEVSNCRSWTNDQKCSWWPRRLTLPLGVKGQQKRQIFDFVGCQQLRCQIVGLGSTIKSVHGNLIVRPFLQGQRSKDKSNLQFFRLRCQIVGLWPTNILKNVITLNATVTMFIPTT